MGLAQAFCIQMDQERLDERPGTISIISKVFRDELLEVEKQVLWRIAQGDYAGKRNLSDSSRHVLSAYSQFQQPNPVRRLSGENTATMPRALGHQRFKRSKVIRPAE